MKNQGRYSTAGLVENQFVPDSNEMVLKNLAGIKTKEEIDRVETERLLKLTSWLLDEYELDHRFTNDDICRMHKRWLGPVYEWAGKYRQVLMSKGGFIFAAPAQIPKLMREFEHDCLKRNTPCLFDTEEATRLCAGRGPYGIAPDPSFS